MPMVPCLLTNDGFLLRRCVGLSTLWENWVTSGETEANATIMQINNILTSLISFSFFFNKEDSPLILWAEHNLWNSLRFGCQVVSFVWILVHLVQTSFMALPNTTLHYSSLIGRLEQCLCVCVCVCVWERDRERGRQRERSSFLYHLCYQPCDLGNSLNL